MRSAVPVEPLMATPPLLLREAAALLGQHDMDGAEEKLRAFLSNDPTNADGWFLLGETLARRGERGQARAAFQRAAGPGADAHSNAPNAVREAARRRARELS